ncbi:zinc finger, CCHC-type containing protein [Tanacetum coccineum]
MVIEPIMFAWWKGFQSLIAGAELVLEAEAFLLPLAGAEDGSFTMTPFKFLALNVEFDFKIDLIVFDPDTGSTPTNFSSGGRKRDAGFKQKSGIDYFDTYAPVARISTIRLLIAMASIHNLVIHQMDVKTTFLNGDLDEEAPKQWHQKFDKVVLSNGYLLNQANKCVYSKFDETAPISIRCDNAATLAKAYSQMYNGKSRHLALGWHLEEIHVSWAHLEKKRTRLRLYTKNHEELYTQILETAS